MTAKEICVDMKTRAPLNTFHVWIYDIQDRRTFGVHKNRGLALAIGTQHAKLWAMQEASLATKAPGKEASVSGIMVLGGFFSLAL